MNAGEEKLHAFHQFPFHGKYECKWDFNHFLYNFCLCIKTAGGKITWSKSKNCGQKIFSTRATNTERKSFVFFPNTYLMKVYDSFSPYSTVLFYLVLLFPTSFLKIFFSISKGHRFSSCCLNSGWKKVGKYFYHLFFHLVFKWLFSSISDRRFWSPREFDL